MFVPVTRTIRSVWQRFLLAVERSLISLAFTFVVRSSSWLTEAVIDAGFTIHGGPTIGLLQKPNLVRFTLGSGHGETLVAPPTEDHVNEWLAAAKGKIVSVTQSESQRPGGGHHITVRIWYVPEAQAPTWELPNSDKPMIWLVH